MDTTVIQHQVPSSAASTASTLSSESSTLPPSLITTPHEKPTKKKQKKAPGSTLSNNSTDQEPSCASGPLPSTYSISNPTGQVTKFTFSNLNGAFLNGAFKAPQYKSRDKSKDIPLDPVRDGINPVDVAKFANAGQPMVACIRWGAAKEPRKKAERRVSKINKKSAERVKNQAAALSQAQVTLPQVPVLAPAQPVTAPVRETPEDLNLTARRIAILETGNQDVVNFVPEIPISSLDRSKKRRYKEIKLTETVFNTTTTTTTTTTAPKQQQTTYLITNTHQPAMDAVSLHDAAEQLALMSQVLPKVPSTTFFISSSQPSSQPDTLRINLSRPTTPVRLPYSPGRDLEDIFGDANLLNLDAERSEGFAPAMALNTNAPSPQVIRRCSSGDFSDVPDLIIDAASTPVHAMSQFLQTINPNMGHGATVPEPVPSAQANVVSEMFNMINTESTALPNKHKHHRRHHNSSARSSVVDF